MRYQDKKYNFSFEIPEGWEIERLGFLARVLGGIHVSIVPSVNDANINIACGPIKPALEDVELRDRALITHVTSSGYELISSGSITDILAEEKNTVIVTYRSKNQQPGRVLRKISSVHNKIEYAITFGGDYNKYKKDLSTVINSFNF